MNEADLSRELRGRGIHRLGVGDDSVAKIALDELHKRKIDLADYVYVLDVDGYIGESTTSEIAYAAQHGIPVHYLSQEAVGDHPVGFGPAAGPSA